jgi:hypothetical protein
MFVYNLTETNITNFFTEHFLKRKYDLNLHICIKNGSTDDLEGRDNLCRYYISFFSKQ